MHSRFLTKSRFQLARECPTKLFYSGNPEYVDNAADNSFLAALAEGGYQVGALARAMHPEGVLVRETDHEEAMAETRRLLEQDNVTIFEAALESQGLFIRVDILHKRGAVIEIIEVKAKSFDSTEEGGFRGKNGQLQTGWLPYLHDVAFQCHVARLTYPHLQIRSALMLVDKSARATVTGLNQRFRVHRNGQQITVDLPGPQDDVDLGAGLLVRVPTDDVVAEILAGNLSVGEAAMPYSDAVAHLAETYRERRRMAPRPGAHCGGCQFKTSKVPGLDEQRSGFHECWSSAFGLRASDFDEGTILDLWNFKKKDGLLARSVRRLRAVTLEDLGHDGEDPGSDGLTAKHRQWYQCHGDWPGGGDRYFNAQGMLAAMSKWKYPLHFIDFETCAVAIPFSAGARPYQTVAFQFSHHVMHADGRVEHAHQFLEATPGVDPCLPFLRALRDAIGHDEGTVFRWATHENTVLNHLRDRLLEDLANAPDAAELVTFIESIAKCDDVAGPREMVDLCLLAQRHFFHPSTKGSSSLKKVLPALMQCSDALREIYGTPRYGRTAEIRSLNLDAPVTWWVQSDDGVRDPYELLPPVFSQMPASETIEATDDTQTLLKDGGAAMTAYARLQFEAIEPAERAAIEQSLLRYCELDTLAMVMAVQAWQSWLQIGDW